MITLAAIVAWFAALPGLVMVFAVIFGLIIAVGVGIVAFHILGGLLMCVALIMGWIAEGIGNYFNRRARRSRAAAADRWK